MICTVQRTRNGLMDIKKIYKEKFLLALSYISLKISIFNDLINFISTLIIEYQEIFIDKLTFMNKDEKNVLCFIVKEIDELKNFLRLQESTFLLEMEGKVHDYNLEVLKNVEIDTFKFIEFNNMNIKLLKTVIYHDVSQPLLYLMYIHGITNKIITQNIAEVSRFLSGYNEQLGDHYVLIENYVFDKIDNFLVDKIVLQNKFDSESLFIYKELVDKILLMNIKKK